MSPSKKVTGFTLIELMIVVAVIAILIAIAVPKFQSLINKSSEGATKGNLGVMRSALSVYYGDNEHAYPVDNLASLILDQKYLSAIPTSKTPPHHFDNTSITAENPPTDTGGWSYNNDNSDVLWGKLVVGCSHEDSKQQIWTSY